METKEKNFKTVNVHLKGMLSMIFVSLLLFLASTPAFAHCDSYDGPVIKDAIKALETNDVKLVFKWITPDQEAEITGLFNKVYGLKNGDREIYSIVEKHFFETLVRLHRETEGAPYTGLKPAGTTKQIIVMSDKAIENDDIDKLLAQLNNHIGSVIREKYHKVAMLNKVKDNSAEEGRAYVKAYVDYTHSLEALHDILENGGGHNH
ncbi:MAG TPA: hypothetical protein GXX42_10360 [Petrimonas sp.]|uniref:DUF6448 family protein n=1 Tax=Petrimonas sp. TaxID=2023866 RepID=UPI0009619F49|nr:DUF6448 family protein [Petrimonas sp.]OJV35047.1 MAG: hypothetical protein BGO33_02375 [Bacteroidia bacterium 43-41]HHV86194.1 hypothetical protein [Petrimonas sp.]